MPVNNAQLSVSFNETSQLLVTVLDVATLCTELLPSLRSRLRSLAPQRSSEVLTSCKQSWSGHILLVFLQ